MNTRWPPGIADIELSEPFPLPPLPKVKRRMPAVPFCPCCHGCHNTHGDFLECRGYHERNNP